jgi:hypothetical protein
MNTIKHQSLQECLNDGISEAPLLSDADIAKALSPVAPSPPRHQHEISPRTAFSTAAATACVVAIVTTTLQPTQDVPKPPTEIFRPEEHDSAKTQTKEYIQNRQNGSNDNRFVIRENAETLDNVPHVATPTQFQFDDRGYRVTITSRGILLKRTTDTNTTSPIEAVCLVDSAGVYATWCADTLTPETIVMLTPVARRLTPMPGDVRIQPTVIVWVRPEVPNHIISSALSNGTNAVGRENQSMFIFPNPCRTEAVTLRLTRKGIADELSGGVIEMYTFNGVLAYSIGTTNIAENTQWEQQMVLPTTVASGMYTVVIRAKNGYVIATQRLFIDR